MKIFYQDWCRRPAYIVLLFAVLTQISFVAGATNLANAKNSSLKVIPPATVKGTVTDDKGAPVVGVSVTVKGSSMGVSTDAQGNYTINVLDNNATLVFTSVGYVGQEIALKGQTKVDVKLSDDSKSLNEVVVIGYGTAKRGDLTGSVSSVSSKDIDAVPVATIDQAMQGRAAGVQVSSNDASPGGGINVQIRGVGSFGNNQPLYVVDGYPTQNVSNINPSDVQSIDILKDAASAAIYGNRASNGVVIITTKRGKPGNVQITLDAQGSVQAKPEQYSMMNATQFIQEAKTVASTDGYPLPAIWTSQPDGYFNDKSVDWQKVMEQTGYRQQYNLAIRGGNQQIQNSFSVGYFNQSGVEKFSAFKRFNGTWNMDYTPYKWLKVQTNVKYSHSNRDDRGTNLQSFLFLIPTLVGGRTGVYQPDVYGGGSYGNFGYFALGPQATNSGQTNIYADLYQRQVDRPTDNLLTTASAEATLLPGLKFKTSLGVNAIGGSYVQFNPGNDRSLNAPLSNYWQNNTTTNEWLWENTLNYNKTFGKSNIDVLAGYSSQSSTYRITEVRGNGSISNAVLNGSSGNTTLTSSQGYTEIKTLLSQFARLSYKFDDKYVLTGSVRRDGSSNFGPGQKYGVFPSAGLSWKIKQESFLKNVDAIDDFSLRASWGKAGNQNIPAYSYAGLYTSGGSANDNRGYVFGSTKTFAPGFAPNSLQNLGLTWETNTQTDIGLDMAFLNNHLTGTIEYYKRVSTNFLLPIGIPDQTGFSSQYKNVGEMQNNGFELAVKYRNYDHAFKWAVGVNGSTIKNRINAYADGITSFLSDKINTLNLRNYGTSTWTQYANSQVGGTINAFYGYKVAGIFQDQASINTLNAASVAKYGVGNYYQTGSTLPGDYKFQDINGDGRITALDRTILGSPLPKFFGGFTLDASYKEWDFTAFIYTSLGNKIYDYARRNLDNFDAANGVGLQNFSTDFYNNHWTPQNHSNTYTRLVAHDINGNNGPSDAWIENGSYARLKTLQIGYTLPASIAKSIHMTKLRIYFGAQNLFTITGYKGLDPEVGNVGSTGSPALGFDQGNYPTSKFYTLGLNVGF